MAEKFTSTDGRLHRVVRGLVAFARGTGRTSCSDTMELRQQCDANTLRVLDALARAKGMERPAYIEALLEEHAKEALHEASLIVRQLRGNPLLVEALGARRRPSVCLRPRKRWGMHEQQLPEPMVPEDCDLADFAFMPLDVARLRDSDLAANETPEACWAAVLLWSAAWHQVPAGSMPDNDAWIAKQAGYALRGRIDPKWKRVREGAMHGWVLCSDGRYHHPVVAEKPRMRGPRS